MQHSISYISVLLQMAEIVSYLSESAEDIIVCCVMHYVRAANGCCRAKHQETRRLMKTWREISVYSSADRKTDIRASVKGLSICVCGKKKITKIGRRGENSVLSLLYKLYSICFKGVV